MDTSNTKSTRQGSIPSTIVLGLVVSASICGFGAFKAHWDTAETTVAATQSGSDQSQSHTLAAVSIDTRYTTVLRPIETLQVGERVCADVSTGDIDLQFGEEVVPTSWRKLALTAPKRDGSVSDVVLLRPLSWVEQQKVDVDGTVYLSVPDCGIEGYATVHSMEACPQIRKGPGQVITGTFHHTVELGMELTIEGEPAPIRCTGNHPFWSENRNSFVPVRDLRIGELLRVQGGFSRVLNLASLTEESSVFNIEVQKLHVYSVGESGVVVHNGNPAPLPDLPGVYIIFDEYRAYVGSAGMGTGGMLSRLKNKSKHPARKLLESPSRTVMFLQVNLGSATDTSERNNILRLYEKREWDKMKKLNYKMMNTAGIQDEKKVPWVRDLIQKYGVTASRRAKLSCF